MKMREILKKIGNWLKVNRMAMLYPLFAVIIEMTAVFAVEGSPFLSHPFMSLGLLAFLTGILLLIPDNRLRLIVGGVLLVVHAVLDLVFTVIYDMTAGTYFDLGMLNLRNDAVAILESIPIDFFVFYAGVLACVIYVIYGLRSFRTEGGYKVKKGKHSLWYYLTLMVAGVATTAGAFFVYYPPQTNKYEEMINGKVGSVYSAYGMIGNLIGEFGNLFKEDTTKLTDEETQTFFYSEQSTPTEHFGIAEGKNVVMILGESLEWFAFMNSEEYPNAFDLTDDELETLYPNLRQFYRESVVATNYHSREKTDISETLSILGSYPTDAYVNYEYYKNTMPNTVPNTLKMIDPDIQTRSFHNGFKTFYNRVEAHKTFGFEDGMTDMYDMENMAKAEWEEIWGEIYQDKDGNPVKYSKDTVNKIVKDYMDAWKEEQGEAWSKEEAERIEEAKREELSLIFTNHEKNGELNLDSEMIEICKDMMFPTDKRFYTYITSITMHGVYYGRENLQSERDRMIEKLGEERVGELKKKTETNEYADALFHYMVSAMELDDALGAMMKDLEDKGLLDDTVVFLYGDHNAYYNQLSNYVKEIDGYQTLDRNFTNLYKVPLMIHDSDLYEKVGHQEVDKFACTSDLVPTLLDLLGIKYYSNMYYGNSLFNEKESVLYSRAYGIFLREGIVGKTVKNIQYNYYTTKENAPVDRYMSQADYDAMMAAFDADAQALVEKIKYCDYTFESDYFGDDMNLMLYEYNLEKLNAELIEREKERKNESA